MEKNMTENTVAELGIPVTAIDPFAEEYILNPDPLIAEVSALGPVIYIEKYGVYGITNYELIHEALGRWEDFQVGAGVGLTNYYKVGNWRPPAMPTEVDPPVHDAPRRVLSTIMTPGSLRAHQSQWREVASTMVQELLASDGFDAVPSLSAAFPLRVFGDAVGLPSEGREDLLAYGDLVFNSFGPDNAILQKASERAADLTEWINWLCQRENLAPDSFGMAVYEAADRGELLPEQAPLVVRSFLSAGVDTTVHGLSSILMLFATQPEQFEKLKANPKLTPTVFDEAVRWVSPLQKVHLTAAHDTELGGVRIPKHEKVMLFLGAANRDPKRWENPDAFDADRDPSGHVGFGMGLHQCVGQHVARLEAMSLMEALVEHVERIELVGEPVRKLNNTLYSWQSVPIRLVPKAA